MQTFYGDLNSAEARYPGLNYCHPPHRMRLGRFPHHRRLFRAFDSLGLTEKEVQEFCCWEGTKWARERYEKDEGVVVRDTTGREIGPYVDRREQRAAEWEARRQSITRKTDISVVVEENTSNSTTRQQQQQQQPHPEEPHSEDDDSSSDADMSDREDPSHSFSQLPHPPPAATRHSHLLNRQIIAAWQQGHQLDPEIEQFLKEQSERGTLHADLDVVSNFHPRALRGYLRPAAAAAAAGAAGAAAQGAAGVGRAAA